MYMREYRRKKDIESDTNKLAMEEKQHTNIKENHEKSENQRPQKLKQNAYMKELEEKQNTDIKEDHGKSVHADFKAEPKLPREEKQNTSIEHHAKSVNDDFKMQADQNIVEKEKYLYFFDSQTNGPIHLQEWAKKNMRDFHGSLKFKIYKYNICHEARPLSVRHKEEATCVCSRCVRDKNATKKSSVDNSMIPSQVPKELQDLTQLEEMLIARVFPVISVYTKPGGQKAYKGHCINFSQDIQELANSLPRHPNQLPVIEGLL